MMNCVYCGTELDIDRLFKGKSVGQRILWLRAARGISYFTICSKTDIGERAFREIELDLRAATMMQLSRIGEVLGVTADQLLFGIAAANTPAPEVPA